MKRALALLGLLMLTACASALNASLPTSTYAALTDAYGPHPRQKLDVYVPRTPGPYPVMVFFYGGSWQRGKREDYRFVGEALASRGILAVIPDYRVFPEVRYPTFLEDNAAAVAWAKRNAPRFGGDPSRLFLAGHSAGAYDAAMLALDARYLQARGVNTRQLRGVIGLSGPYDFLPLTDPKLVDVFGGARRPKTQPITYARGDVPPLWLATGEKDTEVEPRNTAALAQAVRAKGGCVRARVYPRLGHVEMIVSLASGFRASAPTLDDIAAFVRAPGCQTP